MEEILDAVGTVEWAKRALVASELMEKDIEDLKSMKSDLYSRAEKAGFIGFLVDIAEWYGQKDNPATPKYRLAERMGNRNDDDQVEVVYDETSNLLSVKMNGRQVVLAGSAENMLFAPGPWFGYLHDKYAKKLDEDVQNKEEQAMKAQKTQLIAEIALVS